MGINYINYGINIEIVGGSNFEKVQLLWDYMRILRCCNDETNPSSF